MRIFGKEIEDGDDVFWLFAGTGLGLILIVMVLGFGYLIIASIHDGIFQKEEYKSQFLLLDDVQYMDDGDILYRFGDKVIRDRIIKDDFNVNEIYEVVYIRYENSWLNDNGIWEYDEIKEVIEYGNKRKSKSSR